LKKCTTDAPRLLDCLMPPVLSWQRRHIKRGKQVAGQNHFICNNVLDNRQFLLVGSSLLSTFSKVYSVFDGSVKKCMRKIFFALLLLKVCDITVLLITHNIVIKLIQLTHGFTTVVITVV